MPRLPKLTPSEWESIRRLWESDPRPGFTWLVQELGLSVTAPAIRNHATKADPAWQKQGEKVSPEGRAKVSLKSGAERNFPSSSAKGEKPKKATPKPVEEVVIAGEKKGGRPRSAAPKQAPNRPPVIRNASPQTLEVGPPADDLIATALEELTPKEIAFVEAYLECFNGTRAWMAVHGAKTANSAAVLASECLRKTHVRAYLAKRMSKAFADSEGAKARLINTLQAVAYGDANELVEYKRDSCRYCHGIDHLYQYTPAEYKNAKQQAEADKCEFDDAGGVGFDPRREPHPDCPECHGEGKGRVMFKDSRNLSPAGLAIYAGAKVGKDGIEIKMASQEKARETLGRVLKLYEDTSGSVTINLDIATLDEKFVSRMRASHERMAEVMARRQKLPKQ